jgi:integrase
MVRITSGGKRRTIGLGRWPEISLARARSLAAEMREAAREGRSITIAPDDEPPPVPTFAEIAEAVIELRAPTWSNAKHAWQWRNSLENHVYPTLGHKPVDTITSADVLTVLIPIWNALPETATRVQQRLSTVFDFAIAQQLRIDNPAAAVRAALPRRPRLKEHQPALPYEQVPAALATVEASTAREATKLALRFLVLTAARSGEVRGATWDEIDADAATWTVPAERMKARREHRVPLSKQAMDVLTRADALRKRSGLLFTTSKGNPLSDMAMTMLMRRLEMDAVPHGFRTSFRTWALEQTTAPWAVAEAALAHTLGDATEAAYARTDLFERRRELMDAWAA